jgi:hypothetical protein
MKGSFSERFGYKRLKPVELEEISDELRKRIWNWFQRAYEDLGTPNNSFSAELQSKIIEYLWDEFFKEDIQELKQNYLLRISQTRSPAGEDYVYMYNIQAIRNKFYSLKWYEVYDFVENVLYQFSFSSNTVKNLVESINKILEEERAGYRVIGEEGKYFVVPITSPQEIEEIEKTLGISDRYQPVREHIAKAIELYRKRPQADYENSIKESISALEALVKITVGQNGNFSDLIKGLNIHPALKQALVNLYGWTSNEGGIRHGKGGEVQGYEEAGEAEARMLLVLASALVNYLISKFGGRNNASKQ